MNVCRLSKENISWKHDILNTEQDAHSVINKLPAIPEQLLIFAETKSNQSDLVGWKYFKTNRNNTMQWLTIL